MSHFTSVPLMSSENINDYRDIVESGNPSEWRVVKYPHRGFSSKEQYDEYIRNMEQYNIDYEQSCKIDPALPDRKRNQDTLHHYQLRCLRDKKYARLEDNHPRYSYLNKHSVTGMPPFVVFNGKKIPNPAWHRQSLSMMPTPHFQNIDNKPVIVNKVQHDRVYLPRRPRTYRQIGKIEALADEGKFALPTDHAELSTQIEEYRTKKHLTQRQLAMILNCHHSVLRRIERGELIPDDKFLASWDNLNSTKNVTEDSD